MLQKYLPRFQFWCMGWSWFYNIRWGEM